MNSFWIKIKEIGVAGYSVHAIGLGALESEVIDRVALETTGTSNVYEESSDVAVAFFDIISQLKNRNEFMNLSEKVEGEKVIDFTMDEFVSQETFVIRNTDGPIDIAFLPPDGVDPAEILKMVKTENYTLATINQKEEEAAGSWKMKLSGNAVAEIIGAKDLFMKIWINSPISNSLHPIGEPLEIRASLTGSDSEDLIVEGSVTINGEQALKPLIFEKNGNDYFGIFSDTQTRGSYEISMNVRSAEEIIASAKAAVSVKLLPAIRTDLILSEIGFLQGEKRIISSTLTLASTNLKVSEELTLDYFELVKRNEKNDETVINLVDDGVIVNGDVKAEDGIFSGILTFEDEGEHEIIVRARGVYNGDLFILERNLGKTQVLTPGTVYISSPDTFYDLVEGESADIVLNLKSTSPYREVVTISLDGKYGVLSAQNITLDPMEEKTMTLSLMPGIEADGRPVAAPVDFSIGNELTTLSSDKMVLELTVTTNTARIISRIRENAVAIIIALLSLAGVILLIYAAGRVLYNKNVRKMLTITGKLSYERTDASGIGAEASEIDLSKFRKPKIVLTFSPDKKDTADHYIPGSRYDYDLIFEKQMEKSRFKFIDGLKSIGAKVPPKVLIKATEPGILLIGETVLLSYEADERLEFTSGEYRFSYESVMQENTHTDTSRNILEGKF